MKKRISNAFGKKVYLLGTLKYGDLAWLEAPSWDCSWYWGFGYVEVYTNKKNPSRAKDIEMHTHWSCIHDEDEKPFKEMVISDDEYQSLKELFNQWYRLRKIADALHNKDEELYNEHVKVLMPKLHEQILNILTP